MRENHTKLANDYAYATDWATLLAGEIQRRSWSELPQRTGKCHNCGHVEQSDINAARNVLHKLTQLQAAE